MVIILEGIDNVGKGTQIKNILEEYHDHNFHVIHYSGVKKKSIDGYKKQYSEMFNIISNNKYNFILDRSHLGEWVYGQMYRDYKADYIFDLEKAHLPNIDTVILITLIDTSLGVIDRDDGESFTIDKDKKLREIELFKEAHEKSNINNKILIDIKNKNAEQVFKKIKLMMVEYEDCK